MTLGVSLWLLRLSSCMPQTASACTASTCPRTQQSTTITTPPASSAASTAMVRVDDRTDAHRGVSVVTVYDVGPARWAALDSVTLLDSTTRHDTHVWRK